MMMIDQCISAAARCLSACDTTGSAARSASVPGMAQAGCNRRFKFRERRLQRPEPRRQWEGIGSYVLPEGMRNCIALFIGKALL